MIDALSPTPNELPIIPIRNSVLFPGAVAPFDIGRAKSRAVVESLQGTPKAVVAVFTQRDPATDDPGPADLHTVGCAALVLKTDRDRLGNYALFLHGLSRIQLLAVIHSDPFLLAKVVNVENGLTWDAEAERLASTLRDVAKEIAARTNPASSLHVAETLDSLEPLPVLVDSIAASLNTSITPIERKIELLETVDVKKRTQLTLELLNLELQSLKFGQTIP